MSGGADLAGRGPGVLAADRVIDAPPAAVFGAATDWPAQAGWIPLTRVRVVRGDGRTPGSVVEAFTGVGPVGFLDVLEIVRFDPPHAVDVLHTGRWVRGQGAFVFEAVGAGTRFGVREWLHLPGGRAGRLAWRVLRPLLELGARRSLAAFAGRLEPR
jgi:uncharacterized protein YndB with AHSA1/START domain